MAVHGHGVGSVASMMPTPMKITERIAQVIEDAVSTVDETASRTMALRDYLDSPTPERSFRDEAVTMRLSEKCCALSEVNVHIDW